MIRHSFSTSFVPSHRGPGFYTFYLTLNKWEDGKCLDSKTILQRDCTSVREADEGTDKLDWACDLADMAWNIVVSARAAERHQPVRGSNPYPRDTTEKPFLS